MPYITSNVQGRVEFTVEPDPLPPTPAAPHLKLFLILVGLLILFPILGGFSGLLIGGLLLFWFYKGMIGSILNGQYKQVAKAEWRRRYEFEAGSDGLTIDGSTVEPRDIHRIRILMGPGTEVVSAGIGPTYDMGTTSGRARAAGYQKGIDFLNTLIPLTHRVQVEAKGVPLMVAGGVTSATAFAVKTELERALKGEI